MLMSHLRNAFRNLVKRKWYSLINILGLATGMAACLVILEYVKLELSYDDFHKFGERVYRTLSTSYQNGEDRGTYPLSGFAQGPSIPPPSHSKRTRRSHRPILLNNLQQEYRFFGRFHNILT